MNSDFCICIRVDFVAPKMQTMETTCAAGEWIRDNSWNKDNWTKNTKKPENPKTTQNSTSYTVVDFQTWTKLEESLYKYTLKSIQ